VRRVVVTPTFAAGLGVVVAAVLAYPMSRTVFKYSGPDWGGQACPHTGCLNKRHQGGTPALAKPGKRIPTPPPSTQPPPASPTSAPSATATSPPPTGQLAMSYQTVREWDDGFQGQITVTFAGGQVPPNWGLWFSYPSGKIFGVEGGKWQPKSDHTAVVTAQGGDSQPSAGNAIQIEFWVTGAASPPPACTFDRQACQFS